MKRIVFVIMLLASVVLSHAQSFDYPVRVVDGQELYEYPVQKGEGLYRISVNFGVTQEELIRWNPELKTEGLKLGQTILVPVKKPAVVQPKKTEVALPKKSEAEAAKKDSTGMPMPLPKQVLRQAEFKPEQANREKVFPADEEVFFEEDTMFIVEEQPQADSVPVLRLALLLPLQADAQTYDARMERFLKFYEGVLLGLREEKRADYKFEVHVYDVGKTEFKLRKTLALPKMEQMHAIIGPAYSDQIPAARTFAAQHKILCLLPFTSNVDSLESNRYLLQYNPAVPEGMRVVQFKREVDNNWAAFDGLMSHYFNATPSQARPRYDILGYDLTRYFIPAVLKAIQAENDEAWQQAIETEYDGLQSTMRFKRVGQGGFMNTPLRLLPRASVAVQDNENDEQK